MENYDVAIIGGGIVGLATAYQILAEHPLLDLIVIEKEGALGLHQTGRNSGVIHSGIYYKPGSLKANNCREGSAQLIDFCNKHFIAYDLCGKLIVATSKEELSRLDELERRAKANGVPSIRRLKGAEIQAIEPYTVGLEALYSPSTGIVDFKDVLNVLAKVVIKRGGEIAFNEQGEEISSGTVRTTRRTIRAKTIINTSGLHADRLLPSKKRDVQIIPFRGEYFDLKKEAFHLVKGLIYPVPDPRYPFLGVHLTRMMPHGIEVGPNAVLSFKREGYSKTAFDWKDFAEMATFKGFWHLARKHTKTAIREYYRSLVKQVFVKDLQRLVPTITADDLVPGKTGVRAQLVNNKGVLIDDFLIEKEKGIVHVLNTPSPAATSCLSIGKSIANLAFAKD